MRSIRLFASFLVLTTLFGCGSARLSDGGPDRAFFSGNYLEAGQKCQEGYAKKKGREGDDALLYLLDGATAYHTARAYPEAIKLFREADDIADLKDYTRLSTEAATLLVSDQIKQYKAEDFENILINVYLALNYAFLGRVDDALIEARRVNRKIYLMNTEGKRSYGENALAHYLSGALYESQREWNDAFIAYKNALKAIKSAGQTSSQLTHTLGRDLVRMASLLGLKDEVERYKEVSGDLEVSPMSVAVKNSKLGEIFVVFERGISPKKVPSPSLNSIPEFVSRSNPVRNATLQLGQLTESDVIRMESQPFVEWLDVESAARESLKQKWGGIIAKKIAGAAAKVGIGAAINSKTNSGLGTLVTYFLLATDQADTRSWNWLPQGFMVARVRLKPGRYKVAVETDAAGTLAPLQLEVKPGVISFAGFRYVP